MLELKKTLAKIVDNYLGKKEKLCHQCRDIDILEYKDNDEGMKEDNRKALEKQASGGLRKAYLSTQTAIIKELSFKLLATDKVKVGWAIRWLREQVTLKSFRIPWIWVHNSDMYRRLW